MAPIDDLRAYIAQHSQKETNIAEKHTVAIVGETHEPFLHPAAIRTTASVRLLLELLRNQRYRYFANESFLNAGPVRLGVRDYWRSAALPPPVDPSITNADNLSDREIEEIGKRVLTRRFQPILDFLRGHPRYILSIGSMIGAGPARDLRLAQHFFEEMEDRKLSPGIPGVLLLGVHHASAVSVNDWATTRMLLEKRGCKCVSICVLTDFEANGQADDAVFPLISNTPVTSIAQVTSVRLTSLVTATPVTVPTDQRLGSLPSPFRSFTFAEGSDKSVAEQFEYIVLQKA